MVPVSTETLINIHLSFASVAFVHIRVTNPPELLFLHLNYKKISSLLTNLSFSEVHTDYEWCRMVQVPVAYIEFQAKFLFWVKIFSKKNQIPSH